MDFPNVQSIKSSPTFYACSTLKYENAFRYSYLCLYIRYSRKHSARWNWKKPKVPRFQELKKKTFILYFRFGVRSALFFKKKNCIEENNNKQSKKCLSACERRCKHLSTSTSTHTKCTIFGVILAFSSIIFFSLFRSEKKTIFIFIKGARQEHTTIPVATLCNWRHSASFFSSIVFNNFSQFQFQKWRASRVFAIEKRKQNALQWC